MRKLTLFGNASGATGISLTCRECVKDGRSRGRPAVRTGPPFSVESVAALRAVKRRVKHGLFDRRRRIRPVDAGEEARLAGGRNRLPGAISKSDIIVTLAPLAEPSFGKRVPTNRQRLRSSRFDFLPDPGLVDEVHHQTDADGYQYEPKNIGGVHESTADLFRVATDGQPNRVRSGSLDSVFHVAWNGHVISRTHFDHFDAFKL